MKDHIVIAGADGYLGEATLHHLLERGVSPANVVLGVRDPEQTGLERSRGAELRRVDYDEPSTLVAAFQGAESLFFVSSPEEDNGALRVLQHAQVVKAAVDAGVERIVYTGLAFAERSKVPVAHHHLATEYAIRSSGIPYTFLRGSHHTETFVTPQIKGDVDRGAILTNAGAAAINSLSRDDLAKAASVVLTGTGHEYRSYNLVATRPWTYEELAALLSEMTGRTVVHTPVSHEAMVGHLVGRGESPDRAHFIAYLHGAMAEGEGSHRSLDLEHLVGEPLPLRESVRRALAS